MKWEKEDGGREGAAPDNKTAVFTAVFYILLWIVENK